VRWLFSLLLVGSAWAGDLTKLSDVRLVENPSNDGDSFVVLAPLGAGQAGERQLHLRLYFVDCPESVATTDADAKRVREQARYFGITDAKKVFEFGRTAKEFTTNALAQPFTVYTAFSSALGRSPGGRIYAFVITADGRDLGRLLVETGFGRAHGSKRMGPTGARARDIQVELQDVESEAMVARRGIWAATDPLAISRLREEQRAEDREIKELLRESSGKHVAPASVDLNTADARDLQSIPGIGPVLASRIIAARPYKTVDSLLRVTGIGPRLLDKIRPYLVVRPAAEPAKVSATVK